MTSTNVESNEPSRSWAYVLADSDAIVDGTPAVEAAIYRLFGRARGALSVNVDPGSGWISVLAREQIIDRRGPTLVSALDALRIAEKFLRDFAEAVKPSEKLRISFVPAVQSSPLELAIVPHASRSEWNHWIYRTQPELSVWRGGPTASVFGSAIEVRIGDGGHPIGYHSRWRPTTGQLLTSTRSAIPATEPRRAPPKPVYVLDGCSVPQSYLSLHYLVDEGADYALVSGCSLAITVDFELADTEVATRIRAIPSGGSGKYAFAWAGYSITEPFAGVEPLGSGTAEPGVQGTTSVLEIAKGASIVMVHVVDLVTGGFKHYQQLVMASPFALRQEPILSVADPVGPVRYIEEPDA